MTIVSKTIKNNFNEAEIDFLARTSGDFKLI